jgi:rubrerythrin
MNKIHESPESEDEMFEYDESDEYVGEKYSCNECGMTYEGGMYEDGEPDSVCEGCGGTVTRM